MKAATPLAFAGAFLVLGVVLIMTALDQRADERAHLPFKQRLVTKLADPAVAQLALPVAGGAEK